MSLQISFERSPHLILLDITKLLPSFTYNEQQRLSVHLNIRLCKIIGVSIKSGFR